MSQERTERRNFFETKEAVGTKIWALDSGIGEIIEMQHPYSFEMHNGVRWESEKIVDQYLDYAGVEGVSLKKVFPMEEAVRELIGLMNQSDSETQAAGRAAEMNMWEINRLTAERDAAKEEFLAEHRERLAMQQQLDRLNAVIYDFKEMLKDRDIRIKEDQDRIVKGAKGNERMIEINRELAAKVQERDKELAGCKRWAEQMTASGETIMKMVVARDKQIERQASELADQDAEIIRQRERGDRLDGELHKQNCRNQDQTEEIERLRAEMTLVLSIAERAAEDFAQDETKSTGLNLVNIKVNLRAALKGAE